MFDQVRGHWQLLAGALVLLGATVLVLRARHRAKGLDENAREQARERRGRRTEDILTGAVALAAAWMSATQLMRYAEQEMGLHGALRLLPFAGLDVAAVVCALRARRRAARGQSGGISGALVWVLAGISALFSAGEAATVWGAVGRGVWAPIAAVLWEIGLAEARHARLARADRRMGWIRWLHPAERMLVLAELASDEDISATEATRRVRERRTARALHRLRLAIEAREKAKPGDQRTERRYRRAEAAARRAAVRADLARPEVQDAVLPQLDMLVDVAQLAIDAAPRKSQAPAISAPESDHPLAAPQTSASNNAPASVALATTGSPADPPATPPTAAADSFTTPASAFSAQISHPQPELRKTVQTSAVTSTDQPAIQHVRGTVPAQATPGPSAAQSVSRDADSRIALVAQMLRVDPEVTGTEIARRLGVSERTGRRLRNQVVDEFAQSVAGPR